MQKIKLTSAEMHTISRGYIAALSLSGSYSHKAEYMVTDAYRDVRRDSGGKGEAMGRICNLFAQGWDRPKGTGIGDVFTLASWAMTAIIAGAGVRQNIGGWRGPDQRDRDHARLIRKAARVFKAARRRWSEQEIG